MTEDVSSYPLHDCAPQVIRDVKFRPDMMTDIMTDAMTLFVDGCCFRNEATGHLQAGFAVVEATPDGQYITRRADRLMGARLSAQRAELTAMCEVLTLSAGQAVNIVTDSQYVYGLCATELARMARTNWMTTTGGPCRHADLGKQIAINIMEPDRLAIVKCKAHMGAMTPLALGNQALSVVYC